MGARLMAIVAEGERGRIYLAPTTEMEESRAQAQPTWRQKRSPRRRRSVFASRNTDMTQWRDLFTARQLVALTTFSDLVQEARELVKRDALAAGLPDDGKPLAAGGAGATAYADAVAVYLAFAIDRMAMTGNNLVRWNSAGEKAQHCFGRQALPMLWDFAEPNPSRPRQAALMPRSFTRAIPLKWMTPSGAWLE